MTTTSTTTKSTFPCTDASWARALGARPVTCGLDRFADPEGAGPASLLLAEHAMRNGEVATAEMRFADSLADRAEAPTAGWELRALVGIGYVQCLLGRPDGALHAIRRLRSARGDLSVKGRLLAEYVSGWHDAARERSDEGIERALRTAAGARNLGAYGAETILLHQAVRLGSGTPRARLAEMAAERVCRFARLSAAHARALAERDGVQLDTVASCFAAAGLMLEALDARCQAVTILRGHGATSVAWELFGVAHTERQTCQNVTSPAWLEARMKLPLSEGELQVASLSADGFTREAIARRLSLALEDVESTLRAVYCKLRVSDRQALAAILSTRGGYGS